MSTTAGIIIIVIIVAAAILVVTVPRRMARSSRIAPLSHLKCTKCGAEFDYAWIPLASLTSVRLVKWRCFVCPVCRKWSVFNIWDTRVDPETHHCNIRVGPS